MNSTDDILKKILLNMRYDASKTLKENKEIILENPNAKESISNNVKNEGGIKCNSLDDYLKKKSGCNFISYYGKNYYNTYIPNQYYRDTRKIEGRDPNDEFYESEQFLRREELLIKRNNNSSIIDVSILIENSSLISNLERLYGKKGTIMPYVDVPSINIDKDFERIKLLPRTTMGYGVFYTLDNGNGVISWRIENASDEVVKSTLSLLGKTPTKIETDSEKTKVTPNVITNTNKGVENPITIKNGEDSGVIMIDLDL
jgi:hypothetical protein